jgi:putative ATP-binding cassette transporter
VLLEEAFDSLSAEDEVAMFRLICQQLPDAAILTISHQAKIADFHHKTLAL